MTVEQTGAIDFIHVAKVSGDIRLTIVDHLPWNKDEGAHLLLLQKKLNNYLEFIESGQILEQIPDARNRKMVINVVGEYPLSDAAKVFLKKADDLASKKLGINLIFSLRHPA